MLMRVLNWPVVLLSLICATPLLTGCNDPGPQGGPRVVTVPITGIVHVDGKPVGGLLVKCHPVGEAAVPTSVSGYTDETGKFSIGTYESGDGAPEGEYAVTFMWGQYAMNGRYGGPDKLKDRYKDPEKSEHHVTVKAGSPADLGTINLTTQ